MIKWVTRGLLLVWILVIFSFSNQNGEESSGISDKVGARIVNLVDNLASMNWSIEEKNAAIAKIAYPIRKMAHMFEYAILVLLAYISFSNYVISIIIVFANGAVDELHQLFIPGRAGRFTDVLIDTTGGLIMLALIWLFNKIRTDRKR